MENDNDYGILTYFRGSDLFVKPSAVRDAIKGTALEGKVKIPDLQPIKAVRANRAARHFSGTSVKVELIGGIVESGQNKASWGILNIKRDIEGRKVGWEQVERIDWSYQGGFTSDREGGPSLDGQDFINLALRWQSHLDYSWIRSNIAMKCFNVCGAMRMPGGGFFYVHSDMLDRFNEWRDVAHVIPGARMYRIRVDGSDPDTITAIADAAQTDLGTEIAKIESEFASWKERQGRGSTLDRMLDRYTELQGRVHALSLSLSFSADALNAKLEACAKDIRDELSSIPAVVAPSGKVGRASGGVVVQAAFAVMSESGVPMTVSEITDAADELGLLDTAKSPGTPIRSKVSIRLSDAIRKGDPRFVKVKTGVYALAAQPEPDEVFDLIPSASDEEETEVAVDSPEEDTEIDYEDGEIGCRPIPSVRDLENMGTAELRGLAKTYGLDHSADECVLVTQLIDLSEAA